MGKKEDYIKRLELEFAELKKSESYGWNQSAKFELKAYKTKKENGRLARELKAARWEIEITDHLLRTSNLVISAIPECEAHGDMCVPHALDWIKECKKLRDEIPVVDISEFVDLQDRYAKLEADYVVAMYIISSHKTIMEAQADTVKELLSIKALGQ